MTALEATLAAKPRRRGEARIVIAGAALLSLLVAAPVLAMSVPWFCDLYFHMARMAILAHPHVAPLAAWYRPDWHLLPNLAMDLIVPPLAQAMGVAAATRLFLALTLVLTLTGTVALHRAIHRQWSCFPLIAALFVWNWVVFLGFANVLFGNALMLWAAALWFHWRARSLVPALAIGAASALILYVCHLFPLGLFGLVVASGEFARWRAERRRGSAALLRSLAITALPFIIPFLLLLTSRTVAAAAPALGDVLAAKLFAWLTPFVTVNLPVDLTIAAGSVAILYVLLREHALVVAPELRLALVVLPVLVLAIPTSFFGTDLADFRLPALGIFIAIAACRFAAPIGPRFERGILAVVAVLFALRMAALAIDIAAAEPEITAIAQQFRAMPPGAVLFSGSFEDRSFVNNLFDKPENWLPPWRRRDVVPFRHIATMAVLFAPVLVPETTLIDGQQPLAMRPPFRALKALQSEAHVARALTGSADLARWLAEIKATLAQPPYHFTAVYIALSDPNDVAEPPPGIVERFARYHFRIWDASAWIAR